MNPNAIDFITVQINKDNKPSISISGDSLFHTNFFPGQMLQAEIYEDRIIITSAPFQQSHTFLISVE